METKSDPDELRAALRRARVYLIFTPHLCGARDPLDVLQAALPWVDVLQVRPKASERDLDPLRSAGAPQAASSARETFDWCRRVLGVVRASGRRIPVLANDRVDVAAALIAEGLAGVHLGQDDAPPALARALLGPAALVGLSTHSAAQVVQAQDEPVDYLGFGPFRATATKGYARGLGAEACWIAQEASELPVFPIGGIDAQNAGELEKVARAAVGSAILSAPDPARAARAIAEALRGD